MSAVLARKSNRRDRTGWLRMQSLSDRSRVPNSLLAGNLQGIFYSFGSVSCESSTKSLRLREFLGNRRCVEGLVFLPFVDCARKLLKTRLNVTHHQAPIFALTLSSLLVDSPPEQFKCSSQSVDFILKIIVDLPLG